MLNGWTAPAVILVLVGQAAAGVWWASGTDTEVKNNTAAIEQVIENEKEIAIVQVQQQEIVKDIDQINTHYKEVLEMTRKILNKLEE